jgi:hypothetical protein
MLIVHASETCWKTKPAAFIMGGVIRKTRHR